MEGMNRRLRTSPVRSPRARSAATIAAAALLTAGLAACGGAEVEEPTSSAPSVEEAEQSADEAADDAADQGQDETMEPSDGGGDATDGADDATDGAAAGLTVTSEGRGAMILRYTGGAGAEGEALEGKLITGPGGCLALQPGGQPELLLFPEGTEFAENPPRVTIDGTEVKVGGQVSVTASSVDLADLDGVPEQCAAGAATTAWVVSAG